MRQLNVNVLPATADTSTGAINGVTIDTNQTVSASFHCVVSDATAAGTFIIQASNDVCPIGQPAQNFTPTNWVMVPSATVTMAANTKQGMILIPQTSFRWMRAVFTVTTLGTGTVAVNMLSLSV